MKNKSLIFWTFADFSLFFLFSSFLLSFPLWTVSFSLPPPPISKLYKKPILKNLNLTCWTKNMMKKIKTGCLTQVAVASRMAAKFSLSSWPAFSYQSSYNNEENFKSPSLVQSPQLLLFCRPFYSLSDRETPCWAFTLSRTVHRSPDVQFNCSRQFQFRTSWKTFRDSLQLNFLPPSACHLSSPPRQAFKALRKTTEKLMKQNWKQKEKTFN